MGAATFIVLAVFIPPVVLTIVGALLIRGEGTERGRRFRLGIALMASGATLFIVSQLALLVFGN